MSAREMQDVKLVDQQLSLDIAFLADVRDYMRERAEVERDYCRRMEALARKFEARRDKLDSKRGQALAAAGLAAGLAPGAAADVPPSADASAKAPAAPVAALGDSAVSLAESSTCHAAWDAILNETTQSAKRHAATAETFAGELADKLKVLAAKRDESRKKHLVFAQRLIVEREKTSVEVDKAHQRYDEACDLVESSKAKHDRNQDEKAKDKLKRVWHQEILDMNNAKNIYLLTIESANAAKRKHYLEDIPGLLDDMRDLGRSITTGVKAIWSSYLATQTTIAQVHLSDLRHAQSAVDGIDPSIDSRIYDMCRHKHAPDAFDFEFIPCTLWKDLPGIVTDEYSVVFLRNKLAKFRQMTDEVDLEVSVKAKGISGMESLIKAYTANPQQGDADDVRENVLESRRDLVMLGTQRRRLETQIDTIVRTVGEFPPGSRAHNFKTTSFAIPTTCDFCQQTIAYNAHLRSIRAPSTSATLADLREEHLPLQLEAAARPTGIDVPDPVRPELHELATVLYDYLASGSDEISITQGEIVSVVELDDGSGWTMVSKNSRRGLVPTAYIEFMIPAAPAEQPDIPATQPVAHDTPQSDSLATHPAQHAPHKDTAQMATHSMQPPVPHPPSGTVASTIYMINSHMHQQQPHQQQHEQAAHHSHQPSVDHSRSASSLASSAFAVPFLPAPSAAAAAVTLRQDLLKHHAPAEHARPLATVMFDYVSNTPEEMTVYVGDVLQILESDDGSGWTMAQRDKTKGLVPTSYLDIMSQ
ncbi:Protein BZZ1 [Polyrhizophydium stewartii]|uniref:Protein BZZ1 n=1 Tax=Polyrhizophydium stewartii TaxID=2732419 RepID=A0ABR4NAY3_9FUNG